MLNKFMKFRLLKIFFFLLGVFLVVNLSRSIIDLWQKGGLLDKEEERYAKARLENEELTKQYEQIQTPEYIEKEARDKLGLGREGEVVVVLPPNKDQSTDQLSNKVKDNEVKAVWRKWVEVLFN